MVLQFWHPWLHGPPGPPVSLPTPHPGLIQAHLFKQCILPEAENEQEAAVPGPERGEEMLQERDGVWERHRRMEGRSIPIQLCS